MLKVLWMIFAPSQPASELRSISSSLSWKTLHAQRQIFGWKLTMLMTWLNTHGSGEKLAGIFQLRRVSQSWSPSMPLPSNLKYFSCYKSDSNKTNRALSDAPEVVDEVSHCVNVQLLFVIRTLSHSVISLSGENKIFHEHKKSSLGHLTLWGWRARHQCWDRENRLRHGQESCSHRGNRSFHGQESCCLTPTQGTRQRHACTWGYVIAEKYLRGDIFKYCLCFVFLLYIFWY